MSTERLLNLAHQYRAAVAHTLEKRAEFQLIGPADHPAVADQQYQIDMARKTLAEIDSVLADAA